MICDKTSGICSICNKYWFEVYRVTTKKPIWRIHKSFTVRKKGKEVPREILESWSNYVFCCLPCLRKLSGERIDETAKNLSTKLNIEENIERFVCTMFLLLDRYENFGTMINKDVVAEKRGKKTTKQTKG